MTEASPSVAAPSADPKVRPELRRFCEIVGEGNFSTDPIDLYCYSRDLAPIPYDLLYAYGMLEPELVVRPRGVEQVSEILRYANQRRIPITPRGGGSFAMGGTIPIEGGVVLDLCGMNEIVEINGADLTVRVQCGLNWRRLAEKLAGMGLSLLAYPSSGVAATIGGYLGTGGGAGIGVPRNGVAGNSILSLKVVLADGSIVETNPWDSWCFIGAEGTLGVICEAVLKIAPLARQRCFMYAFNRLGDGIKALESLARLRPFFLHFLDRGAAGFLNESDNAALDEAAMTIVAAFQGTDRQLAGVSRQVESICKDGKRYPEDTAEHEWENRFKIEISFKRLGPTLMLQEIRLPFRFLEKAMLELAEALKDYRWGVQCLSSDHGSVCLLIYALTDERDKKRFYKALSLARVIPRIGYRNQGTVYGIALHNSVHLARIHPRSAVEAMRAIKRRFDPNNILNPSKTVQTRVPRLLVTVSMLLMERVPGLMRLGLSMVKFLPRGLIRSGLRVVGGQLR
ncbi:MAG: FAD-binding oxidoreductase [Candidatus Sumerlaeota bacterium]|nr:FAD-binding oxidoreductase [Candidatus Sumerlaeota bacterium]